VLNINKHSKKEMYFIGLLFGMIIPLSNLSVDVFGFLLYEMDVYQTDIFGIFDS
jgi:hypothetical protein